MKLNINKRKWGSILFAFILATASTLFLAKYGGEYGILLFVLTPFLIGLTPILLYDSNKELSKKEVIQMGLITLLLVGVMLFITGIEGIICIAMSAPIGIVLTILGSLIAYFIKRKRKKDNVLTVILVFAFSIPTMSFIDKQLTLTLNSVKTSIIVDANIEKVWDNVVTFPKLKEPNDYLFKAGISYPIEATIEGQGKGAIRYCKFNTGDFIEPITTWNEPNELSFDVQQQPLPMKELSFYDIDAPHLHDYFLSKKGQFKLTKISENKTLLEGTTWYTHNIRPEFYWKIWSTYIIHKIHLRVLEHIKTNAESIEAA